MMQELHHVSVMPGEVLEFLDPKPNQHFLDCTLGGGGHTQMILERTGPKGMVYGIDRDPEAIVRTKKRLEAYKQRIQFFHGDYGKLDSFFPATMFPTLSGALIDCGVSSFQLDDPKRGFSFRFEAPLDMRMNSKGNISAAEFLREINEESLANTLFQLAGERNSRRIAKNIVQYRRSNRLHTTSDLCAAVMESFPKRHYWKIHPATRTFQAIRMAVNEELLEVEKGIAILLQKLPVGSRLVVLTFHSLEDRIVKNIFRNALREKKVKLLCKKPVVPSRDEIRANPRSRSAKLRAIEVIA